ncbi:hypothetical protein BRDID11002_80290 [Bradyrhizobium diazoefficiens]
MTTFGAVAAAGNGYQNGPARNATIGDDALNKRRDIMSISIKNGLGYRDGVAFPFVKSPNHGGRSEAALHRDPRHRVGPQG